MAAPGERAATQTLDYEARRARRTGSRVIPALVTLPLAATAFLLLNGAHWLNAPFLVVRATDVVIFGGTPLVCLVTAAAWCVLAIRRRLAWGLILLGLGWYVVITSASVQSLRMFFEEPWKTVFP